MKYKVFKLIVFIAIIFSVFSLTNNLRIKGISSDEEINLTSYTTEGLIDKIINDELDYINLYSTKFLGINNFIANNLYFQELQSRDNSIDVLNNIIIDNSNEDRIYDFNLLLDILNNNIEGYINSSNMSRTLMDTGIYTPNGSEVRNGQILTNSLDDLEIISSHNYILQAVPTLTNDDYIYPANSAYNCHSFAFYSQNPNTNNFWMNYPNQYFDDFSYERVYDVRPGDILCYFANGFHDTYGTNANGIYVSHSAIVMSIEEGFNINDTATLSKINLISKFAENGVYKHDGDECEYGTKNTLFSYVAAYRPKVTTSYDMDNMSEIKNGTLSIYPYTYSMDRFGMYELDIKTTKHYNFSVQANYNVSVRLYDIHMQLVDYVDLDNANNKVYFTKKLLKNNIYYLRVSYVSTSANGTINTQIISKEFGSLEFDETSLDRNNYTYLNLDDTGMYKLTIENSNSNTNYSKESIAVYEDIDRTIPVKRIDTSLFELDAISDVNCNNLIVYMEFEKLYYIDINLPIIDYSGFKLTFERIYYIEEIDLLSNDESYSIMENETQVGDNFERIELLYDSGICVCYDYSGNQTEEIYFVLYKEVYNVETCQLELELVFPEMMVTYGESLTWNSSITAGTYYIGYYNKTNSESTISITLS